MNDPRYLNKDDLRRFLAMAREVQHEVIDTGPEVRCVVCYTQRTLPSAYFEPSTN